MKENVLYVLKLALILLVITGCVALVLAVALSIAAMAAGSRKAH